MCAYSSSQGSTAAAGSSASSGSYSNAAGTMTTSGQPKTSSVPGALGGGVMSTGSGGSAVVSGAACYTNGVWHQHQHYLHHMGQNVRN